MDTELFFFALQGVAENSYSGFCSKNVALKTKALFRADYENSF